MITPTPPKPTRRVNRNEEAKLQAECFKWIWNEKPETRYLFFSTFNENTQSKYESLQQQKVSGALRKARGLIAGVSDSIMLLPRGRYHFLCIEYKTKTGVQNEHQIMWQAEVERVGGCYNVIRSLEDFKDVINRYLSGTL